MIHILVCKRCTEVILKSVGNEIKIRGKLLVIRDGKAFSVCKGCGFEVEVPLLFDKSVLQSRNLPLFIEKDIDKVRVIK